MDHVSASRGLRLNFVRDPEAIDDIIQDRAPDSPPSGTLASLALNRAVRRRPRDVNHLVLATQSDTGRHAGFLVAHDCATATEPFLMLEATLACAATDRVAVLRRMVGLTILRMVGFALPLSVIAVRTRTPDLCNVLYDLSRRVAGAAVHPLPSGNVVCLATASLAHRVTRAAGEKPRFGAAASAMLQAGAGPRRRVDAAVPASEDSAGLLIAVLDLRGVPEAALIDGARWLYRSRRSRSRAAARAVSGKPHPPSQYGAAVNGSDGSPASAPSGR
jgi:hypothetical protein